MAQARDETVTVDQLREDIDSGRTGEKVAFSDPAAAPLGTDAEAGGHPPTKQEIRLEMASRPLRPARFPLSDDARGIIAYCCVGASITAAIVLIVALG